MRILLISLMIPPDRQDGASKFFRGIFEYLKKQGHDVYLITGKWGTDLGDPRIKQLKIIKKRFLWMPQFTFSAFKFLRSHHFDIVHANAPKGAMPVLLANKKRFITTIHDLGPYETKFTLIPIEKLLIKLVVKKSTMITTCSEFIRKEIKHFFPKVNINAIFNLYSAIEDKYKPYPKEAQLLKDKLGITGPVLLYIGRVAHYKGVDDIIEAFKIVKKEIPDLTLVIGGKPDFRSQKKYEEWKHKYNDIRFVGFVSNEEIPYYYTMGDIFITYSHASEGFGLTPIESIACGTPVICSSLLAYKEVLKDNAVFVPPKSPKMLAIEIAKLLK
ncbi:MAG: glycosyltransferase family 4 protein, partial [archaeon]|nr:glycosyltransferase family 4 protein [archaeon]